MATMRTALRIGFFACFCLLTASGAQAADATESGGEVVNRYGIGIRAPRWISVPGWLLGAMTDENVPLSTFNAYAIEGFLRRGTYDIVVGFGYQNMSPADGNWLGKSKDATLDTDYVQPRGIALLGADISVISRRMFTDYVGAHFGGGLGLAAVLGKVLRTSNAGCSKANAGDERSCRPRVCPASGCTEQQLAATENGIDGGPDFPHRFADPDVPGAFPIVHINLGLDIRVPEWKGFEARFEGGFYDGFFLGSSFAYVF